MDALDERDIRNIREQIDAALRSTNGDTGPVEMPARVACILLNSYSLSFVPTHYVVCRWMDERGTQNWRARSVTLTGRPEPWAPWEHVAWLGPFRNCVFDADKDGAASGLAPWSTAGGWAPGEAH